MEHHTADFYWQTYGWSGGKVVPGVHIYQRKNGQKLGGITVDLDVMYESTYAWGPTLFEGGHTVSLQIGDRGAAVRPLQAKLKAVLGLGANFAIDGNFGPQTRAAVNYFQVQYHLPTTGVVDKDTEAALDKAYAALQAQPTPPVPPPAADHGGQPADLAAMVTAIQKELSDQVAKAEVDKTAAEQEVIRIKTIIQQAITILEGVKNQ